MIDATLIDYWITLDKGVDQTKKKLEMLLKTKLKDLRAIERWMLRTERIMKSYE